MALRPLASLMVAATIALTFPATAHAEEDTPDAAPASPEETSVDPVALDLAEKIVEVGYPEEARENLFYGPMDQTIVQLRRSLNPYLPQDDPEAVRILDEWIVKYTAESKTILAKHIPAIMDGMAKAYAVLFTQDELRDILAFVETDSGKQFLDRMPAVMGEPGFAAANQAYLDESMKVMLPAQRELLDQLQQHREKGADPAETT